MKDAQAFNVLLVISS